MCQSSTLADGDVSTLSGAAIVPDVFGLRSIEYRLGCSIPEMLFDDVGGPARDPGDGKDRREKVDGNSHGIIKAPVY